MESRRLGRVHDPANCAQKAYISNSKLPMIRALTLTFCNGIAIGIQMGYHEQKEIASIKVE
jgi:hypothetical protein